MYALINSDGMQHQADSKQGIHLVVHLGDLSGNIVIIIDRSMSTDVTGNCNRQYGWIAMWFGI